MAKDYIYSIIPVLDDALTDRDLVHRQISASAIKHSAINVAGLNYEDKCGYKFCYNCGKESIVSHTDCIYNFESLVQEKET